MENEKVNQAEEQKEVVETTVTTTEAPAEGAQEPSTEPAPRELFYQRIRTARPDAKYDEDEEEYSRQAMAIMDELEGKAGNYDEMHGRLMKRFNQNPAEAEAFLTYLDGAPLPAAIRRYMGDEALTMKEGDDGWEEFVKAGEEREKQYADNRAALDQYMQNAKDSDAAMEAFIAETGLDEEGAQGFKDVVMSILNDMSAGKVTKETLSLLKRAVDYENDLNGAREQGRVDGRNESIEREKKRIKGSGLPNATAGGSANEEVDAKPKSATADWLKKFGK